MISFEYCRTMARYNSWQNSNLYQAAEGLGENRRRLDYNSFFGSIHATLSHLLWGDQIWMSRLDGWDAPTEGIAESPQFVADWDELLSRRIAADADIISWSARLSDADLTGDLAWFSGALGKNVQKPLALCIMHFFNHQTHHRGQVHAMLTAAGASPGDTDLFIMPDINQVIE